MIRAIFVPINLKLKHPPWTNPQVFDVSLPWTNRGMFKCPTLGSLIKCPASGSHMTNESCKEKKFTLEYLLWTLIVSQQMFRIILLKYTKFSPLNRAHKFFKLSFSGCIVIVSQWIWCPLVIFYIQGKLF